jgi:hypothetical protein
MLAQLRHALDGWPACKALIKRFQGDAGALLACQAILKTRGLGTATVAQCEPLIDAMPTAAIRQEFRAYLVHQLGMATTLGLGQVGVPISSESIESLFGVGKRHGVGETLDAAGIALRLPAFCGTPTRQEAEQVLGVSVARQREFSAARTSLTQQRREVLSHPECLERLRPEPDSPHWELIPSPKKQAINEVNTDIKMNYENNDRTPFASLDESMVIENTGPPGCERIALTS